MKRISTFLAFFLAGHLLVLESCSSPSDVAAGDPVVPTQTACNGESPPCSDDSDMLSVCVASHVGEKFYPRFNRFYSYGKGSCAAKNSVLNEVCKSVGGATTVKDLSCYSDPTDGECTNPELKDRCSDNPGATVCLASEYDGQQIGEESLLVGWGDSECAARRALVESTCRQQLRPSKLESIVCEKTKYLQQCNSLAKSCGDDFVPVICELEVANQKGEKFNMKTYAENKCLAQLEIKTRLCLKNLDPNQAADKVHCRQEK